MKLIYVTALVIFTGAVLFYSCQEVEEQTTAQDTTPVDATINYDSIPDSLVDLGETGYQVLMPRNCEMEVVEENRKYRFYCLEVFVPCSDLTIDLNGEALPIVGRRPINSVTVEILGQASTFRDYSYDAYTCVERSGSIQTPDGVIAIECTSAGGEKMEELFRIAASLHRAEN